MNVTSVITIAVTVIAIYLLLWQGCVQNTESGFPRLSGTFLCAFSRTFQDHLCPFSMSFRDCLIEWISNKTDFHITLNMLHSS